MDFFTKISTAFHYGGIWMWPILGLQLVSFAIIIERSVVLFLAHRASQKSFVNRFEESIRRGNIDSVLTQARSASESNPVARAVAAGAESALDFGGRDEIQGKMDEVLLHENSLFDRRIGFLAMIGNVSTLTGLLGTITGMIKSFAAVAYSNPSEKASLLAAGISEAMNATAYGLIVAIPSLVAFAILQNRSNLLAEDLNQAALRAFHWLSYAYEPVSEVGKGAGRGSAEATGRRAEANA